MDGWMGSVEEKESRSPALKCQTLQVEEQDKSEEPLTPPRKSHIDFPLPPREEDLIKGLENLKSSNPSRGADTHRISVD